MQMTARPRLAPGTRLHHDALRNTWVLLAPERMVRVDDVAYEILSRCDGRDLAAMCASLADCFATEADSIAPDVDAMLTALAERGYLRHD